MEQQGLSKQQLFHGETSTFNLWKTYFGADMSVNGASLAAFELIPATIAEINQVYLKAVEDDADKTKLNKLLFSHIVRRLRDKPMQDAVDLVHPVTGLQCQGNGLVLWRALSEIYARADMTDAPDRICTLMSRIPWQAGDSAITYTGDISRLFLEVQRCTQVLFTPHLLMILVLDAIAKVPMFNATVQTFQAVVATWNDKTARGEMEKQRALFFKALVTWEAQSSNNNIAANYARTDKRATKPSHAQSPTSTAKKTYEFLCQKCKTNDHSYKICSKNKSRSGSNTSNSSGTKLSPCAVCKQQHETGVCPFTPLVQKVIASQTSKTVNAVSVSVNHIYGDDTAIIDSGAAATIFRSQHLFATYTALPLGHSYVTTAGGHKLPVLGRGKVVLTTVDGSLTIDNCLHVQVATNLISPIASNIELHIANGQQFISVAGTRYQLTIASGMPVLRLIQPANKHVGFLASDATTNSNYELLLRLAIDEGLVGTAPRKVADNYSATTRLTPKVCIPWSPEEFCSELAAAIAATPALASITAAPAVQQQPWSPEEFCSELAAAIAANPELTAATSTTTSSAPVASANKRSTYTLDEFHSVMGHLNHGSLVELASALDVTLTGHKSFCDACVRAKSKRATICRTRLYRPDNPGHIEVDLSGPHCNAIGGYRFFIVFTDVFLGISMVYLQKTKSASECRANLRQFVLDMRTKGAPNNYSLTHLHCDNEKALNSQQFIQECAKHNIHMSQSPPYTPEYNATVEKRLAVIWDMGLAMRKAANLPDQFWGMAVLHAATVRSMCPTTPLQGIVATATPYERFTGRQPPVHKLEPFGTRVFVHKQKMQRASKNDDKAVEGIAVGYDDSSRSLIVFFPDSKQTVRTIHYTVDSSSVKHLDQQLCNEFEEWQLMASTGFHLHLLQQNKLVTRRLQRKVQVRHPQYRRHLSTPMSRQPLIDRLTSFMHHLRLLHQLSPLAAILAQPNSHS